MLGVIATLSQISSKLSYDTWFERPCAHASAIGRGFVQDDGRVDEDEVEEEVVVEIKVLNAEEVVEDAQLPLASGGGAPPASRMRLRELLDSTRVTAKSTLVHVPVIMSYWTAMQGLGVASTLAMHEARQSSALS
jgi:hypothetical protein